MKQVFSIAAFLLLQTAASAQFYVAPTFGYGWQANKTQIAVDVTGVSSTGWMSIKAMYSSVGGGLNSGICLGYVTSKGLILEVGINHLFPNEVQSSVQDTMFGNDLTLTRICSARRTNVFPSIGFQTSFGKWRFYSKTALTLGVGVKLYMTVIYTDAHSSPSELFRNTIVQYGPMSVGMSQRLGVAYAISDQWHAHVELNGVFQNWSPRFGELTKSESNGIDQMSGYDYSTTHYVYVESLSQPSMSSGPDQRSEHIKPMYSLSSIGFSVAVAYSFNIARK